MLTAANIADRREVAPVIGGYLFQRADIGPYLFHLLSGKPRVPYGRTSANLIRAFGCPVVSSASNPLWMLAHPVVFPSRHNLWIIPNLFPSLFKRAKITFSILSGEMSSFGHRVGHVICWAAKKQVLGVAANWIVAPVANKFLGVEFSSGNKYPKLSIGQGGLPLEGKDGAIQLGRHSICPVPTPGFMVNFGAIFDVLKEIICHAHGKIISNKRVEFELRRKAEVDMWEEA